MKPHFHSPTAPIRLTNALTILLARSASLWTTLGCAALLTTTAQPARAAVVTEAWVPRYNGPTNGGDSATAVAVDGVGNVVVTGYSASEEWSDPMYGRLFINDYYTAKYAAADGALLWEKRYNGPANSSEGATALALDGSGNVVVTGDSGSGTNGANGDYYTAKYAAADGALLWEKRYNGPTNGGDYARALALDGSGNVVVTGWSDVDYYTAKYAAADGALLWEKRYNGPGNYDDAQAVAVDGSGNVVVTGTSYNANFNPDYYTAKYAAADGALLWEKRYNSPADRYDRGWAVAVDGSGNVVVTGSSQNSTLNDDYYTAKYAAADGALLWEKRYNGPANANDSPQALALDGSGNVVVTGWSSGANGNTNTDYYTAKYAAADGALLWEKRYNGSANSSDGATALALDGSGNVVVTGWSSGANGKTDYYTVKYAAADGALLWGRRYNGPANGDDYASSLALGPNGMVVITGSSEGNFGPGSYDYATVVYRENLPSVSIELVPAGIRLSFRGVSGRTYAIERAPAVTGPWISINTPTAPIGGLIEYLDTNAPLDTAFYRTSTP